MREAMAIADEIIAERRRQIEAEGFDNRHDDAATRGTIAMAASVYASRAAKHARDGGQAKTRRFYDDDGAPAEWPWGDAWWKPKNVRRDLIRAAALIVAEIERLDRAARSDDAEDVILRRHAADHPSQPDGFNPLGSGPEAITPRDILNIAAAQAATALEDI